LIKLLVEIASRIIQQFLDAPVGKPSRRLGEIGVLPVSLRVRLELIARHLPPDPAPIIAWVPAEQPTKIAGLRVLDLLTLAVAQWVRRHHGHCLPAGQHPPAALTGQGSVQLRRTRSEALPQTARTCRVRAQAKPPGSNWSSMTRAGVVVGDDDFKSAGCRRARRGVRGVRGDKGFAELGRAARC